MKPNELQHMGTGWSGPGVLAGSARRGRGVHWSQWKYRNQRYSQARAMPPEAPPGTQLPFKDPPPPNLVPALLVLKLAKETSQPAPVGPTASAVSLCPAHLSSARSLPPSQQTAGSLGGRGSYRHAGSSQALWFPGSESLHSFII